jgi:hypothetical protein
MISLKTTQNLHLPHDTRFFQDLYKTWQAWTRNMLQPRSIRFRLFDKHVIHVPFEARYERAM